RGSQTDGSDVVRAWRDYAWVGSSRSVLRRRLVVRRARRTAAVLGHEGVELFLVLGVAQPGQELLELALLFLEPAQRIGAVIVESAVTAAGRTEAEAKSAALHAVAHAIHLPLHPFHLVLPAITVIPATHLSAPECEEEKREPDRPPDQEAENGHGNPAGMPGAFEHVRTIGFLGGAAPSIDICGVGHVLLHNGITPP